MTELPLLHDARELIAILQGRADNPLLEQWKLARQRRWERMNLRQRLGLPLRCALPWWCLVILLQFTRGSIGTSEDLLTFAAIALGPVLVWLALGLMRSGPLPRITLLLLGIAISSYVIPDIAVHADEDYSSVMVLLLGMPALTYVYSLLFQGVLHGLELTGARQDGSFGAASEDVRCSMLENREVLLALLAFHLPRFLLPLLVVGMNVNLLLLGSLRWQEPGSWSAPLAFMGGVSFICFSYLSILLLLLLAVTVRIRARFRLMHYWLALGTCIGQALLILSQLMSSNWIYYSSSAVYLEDGLAAAVILLASALLMVPVVLAFLRGPWALRLLAICSMLPLAGYVLVMFSQPDPDYAGAAFFYGFENSLEFSMAAIWAMGVLLGYALLLGLLMRSARARFWLFAAPGVISLLSFVLGMIAEFTGGDKVPLEFLGMMRLLATLTVGSVFDIGCKQFWSDFGINVTLYDWWWPLLQLLLCIVFAAVLHSAALRQIAAWRRLEE